MMMRTNTDLLDTIARRLGVSLPDLRDWCPLLSLQALLEVDNRAFPVEEWNRALAYSLQYSERRLHGTGHTGKDRRNLYFLCSAQTVPFFGEDAD